jgi:hypothetical protein
MNKRRRKLALFAAKGTLGIEVIRGGGEDEVASREDTLPL